jgi:hypothetical protein
MIEDFILKFVVFRESFAERPMTTLLHAITKLQMQGKEC